MIDQADPVGDHIAGHVYIVWRGDVYRTSINLDDHTVWINAPEYTVSVPKAFQFDGASVPLVFRMLVPMAHPNYIQAAALHDYMLDHVELYGRRGCDKVFFEALGVLGMPLFWRLCLYYAVRIGAVRWHFRKFIARFI